MFEKRTHLFSIMSNTVSRKISNSQKPNLYAVKKQTNKKNPVTSVVPVNLRKKMLTGSYSRV